MKKTIALLLAAVFALPCGAYAKEKEKTMYHLYEKGNFANSFTQVGSDPNSRAWREGMVGGNGETGFVTAGSPYSDTIIYQHMYFNYPSSQPREIPSHLTDQLEEARENVFNLNDSWEIWDYDLNGNKVRRSRTYYYSYHPGAQLRINSAYSDTYTDYERWTNYLTAEVGVRYTDKYGQWIRTTFTSREDNVTITKIQKSSQNHLINTVISIDNIADMCKSWNGMSKVRDQRYKKLIGSSNDYIALVSHYPPYSGSELYDGGYGSVVRVIAEGANAKKTAVSVGSGDEMLIGDNKGIKIENAETVYLITSTDRTFSMTGKTGDVMTAFKNMTSYPFIDELNNKAKTVQDKYTSKGIFDYNGALAPSAAKHNGEFGRLTFDLEGDEEYSQYDNNALIALQRGTSDRINHEFIERSYMESRYAQICAGGTTAPRLYGMWTGEWNPGWRGIYTLDANVNLQVSAMNTGNLRDLQLGYITFFLRHAPDFMLNAEKAYGMHDAIQLSVNVDADRGMHVEYDSAYPFEYWNAGASWCLLPIYEYWQCFGNAQIPINDYMRFDDLQKVLGVQDGGLSDSEFAAIKERGWLDLESDILLPLLTKQANFWEQIVTPGYYTDINGKACHDENKTGLNDGEKYIIIPAYSPENHPVGYTSTLTANATMDISAARDGLDMVCAMEEAVAREGYKTAVAKWQELKNNISDYKTDLDGALREWAMEEYTENNNHRHLSHLYVAWPAYDTQKDPVLAKAANIALNNRNRFNTGDATAGHGWMHKALVEARLKRGDGMMDSLLKMMNGTAYYSSLITDHDTNRRNDTYCTDTAFGAAGAVNEALVFSNTGEIEIIPALPTDWRGGHVTGLMARTRAEITSLNWSFDQKTADVTITSNKNNNQFKLRCGEDWERALINGAEQEILHDSVDKYILLTLDNGESVTVNFDLGDIERRLIVKDGDAEVGGSIFIEKGGSIKLTAQTTKNSFDSASWQTDSMAIASVDNGVVSALNAGVCKLTVKMGSFTKEVTVTVTGQGDPIQKIQISASSGSEGYNGSWSVANAFDGSISKAYASKDNSGAKWLQAELSVPSSVTKIYVVGRLPESGENYASRINGALIYGSSESMNGDITKGTLVGEISGVTADSSGTGAVIPVNTQGESYKYYMICFNKVNNGSNTSMAAAEIQFYTGFTTGAAKQAVLSSASAPLAIDSDISTSASASSSGEFVFELNGEDAVTKIVVKKQKNALGTNGGNYWADWILSVGCVIQGSFDGSNWEHIASMNPLPDGTDNTPEAVFVLQNPKAYKYIRYVRESRNTSYGLWYFGNDPEKANQLNLAEIEVYTYSPFNLTVSPGEIKNGKLVFNIKGACGKYVAYLARYNDNGILINVKTADVNLQTGETDIAFDCAENVNSKLYIWHNMQPCARVQ